MSEFDQFAKDYDAALTRGISLSGEAKDFFAVGRIAWLKRKLHSRLPRSPRILDFGCGTGTSTPLLKSEFEAGDVIGTDTSSESLEVARVYHKDAKVKFLLPEDIPDEPIYDLVFCNGVFHHISAKERPGALSWIHKRVKPGGLFVMWENNPLNIGTQIIMNRIPFDKDAEKILPWTGRHLLSRHGFRVEGISYLFVFPRVMKVFRFMEPALSLIPLGAQYQIIAQKAKITGW